jgi:hypothetical protein
MVDGPWSRRCSPARLGMKVIAPQHRRCWLIRPPRRGSVGQPERSRVPWPSLKVSAMARSSRLAHLVAAACALGALIYGVGALVALFGFRGNPERVEGLVVYSTLLSGAWALALMLFAIGFALVANLRQRSRWSTMIAFNTCALVCAQIRNVLGVRLQVTRRASVR